MTDLYDANPTPEPSEPPLREPRFYVGGFHSHLDGATLEGAAKGNRPRGGLPPSWPLSGDEPFKNVRRL